MISQVVLHDSSRIPEHPFVCAYKPIIGTGSSPDYPSVCRYRPNIGSSRIFSGFTLVELMITLVVLAILLGIGVPNLRSFVQNSRVTTQSNEIIGDLATARSEAIKRNRSVALCRSTNPTAAAPSCATGSGGWESGWIMFQDSDSDGTFSATSSPADILLRAHDPIPGGITVRAGSAAISGSVVFMPSGMTNLTPPTGTDPAHHFALCDSRGAAYGRAIVLENTGRARVGRLSNFPDLSCP